MGKRPAIVVVDFAYGWTDDTYAGGSKRLDEPVRHTQQLLNAGRRKSIPIIYTSSTYRPQTADQPIKSAADKSPNIRAWDAHACEIDERVQPEAKDLIILKEHASAFFGTHLAPYLIQNGVDTVLITGCSTSACIRATATDAGAYRFRPIIVRECVGDRAEAAHLWTLFDIQARFADVINIEAAIQYIEALEDTSRTQS